MNMEKIMNELTMATEFLNEHRDFYTGLSENAFLPLICMMMEEYCKENELDMVDTMRMCLTSAEEVNEMLGAY